MKINFNWDQLAEDGATLTLEYRGLIFPLVKKIDPPKMLIYPFKTQIALFKLVLSQAAPLGIVFKGKLEMLHILEGTV